MLYEVITGSVDENSIRLEARPEMGFLQKAGLALLAPDRVLGLHSAALLNMDGVVPGTILWRWSARLFSPGT